MRIEIGPRDVEQGSVVVVRRDTGEKTPMPMEGLREKLEGLLEEIQANLFKKAQERTEAMTFTVDSYEEYKERIGNGGFFRVFLDYTNPEVEEKLQADTKSTVRCIPFDAPEDEGRCMISGAPCTHRVLASQSY